MNIVILANRDIASNVAINQLLAPLSEHDVTIMLSSRVGKTKKDSPLALKALRFFEQDLFNDIVFPLVTQKGEATDSALLSFDQIAQKVGKPITMLTDVKSEASISALRACNADLFISIRFGLILHDSVISLPRLGIINLHSGILPNYKGVMATFWAMKNRDRELGTTLHFIQDSRIDSGDIIAISKIKADYNRSYWWNVLKLYETGCQDLVNALQTLCSDRVLKRTPQKPGGRYYSFPTHEDLQIFSALGGRLFYSAEVIEFFQSGYQ